jgi:AcrR family transcriptional regulator
MVNTIKRDRQDAVKKATDLFWKKGFHATSMRDLQEKIDMRPGSIYASFGSKEGLFKAALHCYADASRARIQDQVEKTPSPLAALKGFIRNAVLGIEGRPPNEMCMLVKTVLELTEDNADLQQEAKDLLKGLERYFAELLQQAQQDQELDPTLDAQRLARFLQMQLIGMRAYARANNNREQVEQLLEDAFSLLKQPHQSTP